MNDFLNYVDRGYSYESGEDGLPIKEKTLVVDGCSMAGSRDDNQDYLDILGDTNLFKDFRGFDQKIWFFFQSLLLVLNN